jgi:hypothetical protein
MHLPKSNGCQSSGFEAFWGFECRVGSRAVGHGGEVDETSQRCQCGPRSRVLVTRPLTGKVIHRL